MNIKVHLSNDFYSWSREGYNMSTHWLSKVLFNGDKLLKDNCLTAPPSSATIELDLGES
jgi:hypothetical protein